MSRALQAPLLFLGFASLCSLIAAVLFAPSIATFLVGQIFANVNKPEQREPPPTPYAIPFSSSDVQVLGGKGLGLSCSIPDLLDWLVFRRSDNEEPISLQMRQACIAHDYCYRHGAATYGFSQEDCDYALLDEAQRLCWFLVGGEKFDQEKCRTQAKKVLLGVRIGGNSSFARIDIPETKTLRQDNAANANELNSSTYFEYAPYPYNSKSYHAYRLAELPARCEQSKGRNNGLYSFHVRPAGIIVSVYSNRGSHFTKCASFTLPGSPGRLTFAPTVVKRKSASGLSEEWFVWWMRGNMESTHGRFVAVAPNRACASDWRKVFPGFELHFPLNDSPENRLCPIEQSQKTAFAGPAAFTAETGKKVSLENNANEFHSAPGLEADGLRLVAMRVHSCDASSSGNPLCYNDFVLDPTGGKRQIHEPLKVRDQQNKFGNGTDNRRYRNLTSAPMVVAGSDMRPVITWLRRGESDLGKKFANHAEIRRQRCAPSEEKCKQKRLNELTSENLGIVKLENFSEADEPVLLVGRTSTQPALVSFQADDRSGRINSSFWIIPPQLTNGQKELGYEAESAPRKEFQQACTNALDSSWLFRPPVLYVTEKTSGTILFTRVRTSVQKGVFLEILTGKIDKSGTCSFVAQPIAVPVENTFGKSEAVIVNNLQKSPTLIAINDDIGKIEVIIPNILDIINSLIVTVEDM